MMLGIDLANDVILGLDPLLYELLPMGISFYMKEDQAKSAQRHDWHVWEKENRAGAKRDVPRSPTLLETFIGFTPSRLLDFARFERKASGLGLDPALRHSAARDHLSDTTLAESPSGRHELEEQFEMSSKQLMEIIANRTRLTVAVRGGVAEHHLSNYLAAHPQVHSFQSLDEDSKHDFDAKLLSGPLLRIECKNASPTPYKDGTFKVEVQKTRASIGDPASRFYKVSAFDVVAACMYSPTGAWTFRFARTKHLDTHNKFPDRLAPLQRIDSRWVTDLNDLSPIQEDSRS